MARTKRTMCEILELKGGNRMQCACVCMLHVGNTRVWEECHICVPNWAETPPGGAVVEPACQKISE
eukprot:2736834-Amphidinium_carterae.1